MGQENPKSKLKKVYSTFHQTDLLLAKMALDREGIRYETTNENFAALYPGADGMATVVIFVEDTDMERARQTLGPFIKENKEEGNEDN